MSYDLDQFIADCRAALKRDPGPGGRETVRVKLEELLRNQEFIEEYCGEKVAARAQGALRGPGPEVPDSRPHQ